MILNQHFTIKINLIKTKSIYATTDIFSWFLGLWNVRAGFNHALPLAMTSHMALAVMVWCGVVWLLCWSHISSLKLCFERLYGSFIRYLDVHNTLRHQINYKEVSWVLSIRFNDHKVLYTFYNTYGLSREFTTVGLSITNRALRRKLRTSWTFSWTFALKSQKNVFITMNWFTHTRGSNCCVRTIWLIHGCTPNPHLHTHTQAHTIRPYGVKKNGIQMIDDIYYYQDNS